MSVHIYTAKAQPATDWADDHSGKRMRFTMPYDAPVFCQCCHQNRPAVQCVVHAYYDGVMFFCAPGHGCKDPQVIADRKAKEFQTRSAAQKARWAKKA